MFKNMEISFSYYRDKKRHSVTFNDNFLCNDFRAIVHFNHDKSNERLKVSIIPIGELEIEELSISMNYPFTDNDKIFVNGYQSWTDSREFFIDEKMKSISRLAAPIMKKYQFDKYGDYTFKKYSRKSGEFHGYTYSYVRNGENFKFIGSLTEKNGYTIIQHFVRENNIIIEKECRGHKIHTEYTPFELVLIEGSEKVVFDSYFDLMNVKKPTAKPMTGWTSWYNYYQNINEEIILENLNSFQKFHKNIELFQIDDGYQTFVGDWLDIDDDKFPNGMGYIVEAIKQKGYKAGIWLAPFVCETNSRIFKEKKHWILKNQNGELVLGGSNWSKFYALDLYNQEVRAYIKKVFQVVLEEWGYDMVKLDFLYAVCLIPRETKTRGQIMTEAMEFLRECVGDKLILGCGVPLGPSFGQVDYCRIGCDIGLDWDDKAFMRLLHRERISTLNAIGNAMGRRQLSGRAFLNDPDVFLLREDNISLSETQRETLSTVNHIFGSLLFTSDHIENYDGRKHLIFDQIMNLKEKKIHSVDSFRNGLVEVVYTQEDSKEKSLGENKVDSKAENHAENEDENKVVNKAENKYIALINLKNKSISYPSKFNQLKEVYFDKGNQCDLVEKTVKLEPYESRVFMIQEDL